MNASPEETHEEPMMMTWEKPNVEAADEIAGDRREDRRYDLHLDVKWKLIRRRRILDAGVGSTVDLSSGGLLFDAGRGLPEGLNVELSISWPVLLHNVAPLQLVVSGKIVRSRGRQIAIRTIQHEFRTIGIPAEQRNVLPMTVRTPAFLAPQPVFASFGKLQ